MTTDHEIEDLCDFDLFVIDSIYEILEDYSDCQTNEDDSSVPPGKIRYCGSIPAVTNFPTDGKVDDMTFTTTTDCGITYIEVIKDNP